MAPPPVTDDYYAVLELDQESATLELITKSYRRLALKLHPDRSAGSTQAFQLLGQAYDTLRDPGKRRDYDRIYPSTNRSRAKPQSTQTPPRARPPPASASQSNAASEAAQIAALRKEKEERAARWRLSRSAFNSSIFELQRAIRRLEKDVSDLDDIAFEEAFIGARKDSWGAWIFTSFHNLNIESEDEKARKDRMRQERRIEKDLKERRLDVQKAQLLQEQNQMEKAKKDIDAADLRNDQAIHAIETKKRAREAREQAEREMREREKLREREKAQGERLEKIRKQQQEQRQKEAAEKRASAQQQAEARGAEWARQEREAGQERQPDRADDNSNGGSTHQAPPSSCNHDYWWEKAQYTRHVPCPVCDDAWTFLLRCPGCEMDACPKCQRSFRPRAPRNARRR